MAGATLTTVNEILKEYYLGPVQEQLNNEVLLLQRLEARSEDLVGKAAFVPLHYGRSGGIGAVGESNPLPAAGSQTYERAEYDLKYLYGRVQVTGPSMAKTKSDAGAFLQILRSELDGVRNDLRKDLARQVYGYGDGVVGTGTPDATTATTHTITLASWEPLKKGQIYVGMNLELFIASTGAKKAEVFRVDAVALLAATTSTVTVSSPSIALTAVPHTLARAGSVPDGTVRYGSAARSNEVDGLQRLVTTVAPTSNTNTIAGGEAGSGGYVGKISAVTRSFWDNQRTAVTGPLTLQAMQTATNTIRMAGGQTTAIITSLGVMREFYRLLTTTQQFITNDGTTDFKAGFQTVSYNGVPVIGDIDAPFGNMYFLDESTIKVFSDQDWHFLDADGSTLRHVADYDAFEAIMARYMNIGATRRNTNMVLSGITVNGAADSGV